MKGVVMLNNGTKVWSLVRDLDEVNKTQVFSGGACNYPDATGQLMRNTERDPINQWLSDNEIYFFDPQIHPDTHGREYDYTIDHELEMKARAISKINLYEVSPHTFGGITSLEIAADQFRWQEPMVIYFSDGNPLKDDIPAHSDKGHPLFVPNGIHETEAAMHAHYREFIKNGNNMRKYLMGFAREMDTLTVNFGDQVHEGDVEITPDRIHAADLFRAVVDASNNRRVFVTFTGGKHARDAKGNPLFITPDDPAEVQMLALLDQYVDEGNELRRSIAQLVGINVFARVVYTQRSAMYALEEIMRVVGML
jgi:hypothetical protein